MTALHGARDARPEQLPWTRAHKPRLRGVSHQWAFLAACVAGSVLVLTAPTGRATAAAAIYAAALTSMFGASALYHRVNWRPGLQPWMRRLDHSMIFVLIAGTYTPVGLLLLHGTLARGVLAALWGGALLGMIMKIAWLDAPSWVIAAVYVALGWVGAATLPQLAQHGGLAAALLIAAGGLLYTVGAVVYARKRPDPRPSVFGFHEVFHLLVIAAAAVHFTALAIFVIPHG